jgi:hypothetical protein
MSTAASRASRREAAVAALSPRVPRAQAASICTRSVIGGRVPCVPGLWCIVAIYGGQMVTMGSEFSSSKTAGRPRRRERRVARRGELRPDAGLSSGRLGERNCPSSPRILAQALAPCSTAALSRARCPRSSGRRCRRPGECSRDSDSARTMERGHGAHTRRRGHHHALPPQQVHGGPRGPRQPWPLCGPAEVGRVAGGASAGHRHRSRSF